MSNKGRRDSFSDEDADPTRKLEQNELDEMDFDEAAQRDRSTRSRRDYSAEDEQKARYEL